MGSAVFINSKHLFKYQKMEELREKREEIDGELLTSERQIETLEAKIEESNDQISRLHPLDPSA